MKIEILEIEGSLEEGSDKLTDRDLTFKDNSATFFININAL